jgi:hypothetical protein
LKSARNIQGAMKESGDVNFSGAKIHLELGGALAGRVPPRANETTIFKSLRMAAEVAHGKAERLPYNRR